MLYVDEKKTFSHKPGILEQSESYAWQIKIIYAKVIHAFAAFLFPAVS